MASKVRLKRLIAAIAKIEAKRQPLAIRVFYENDWREPGIQLRWPEDSDQLQAGETAIIVKYCDDWRGSAEGVQNGQN